MYKFSILLLALFFISAFSCNKYEEGPKMSLLTKKDRFARSWKLESTETNGVTTVITDEENIFYVFKKNATYSKTFQFGGIDSVQIGNWNLSQDKNNLELSTLNSLKPEESKIILLTNKTFKIRDLTEIDPTTYQFVVN